MKTIRQFTIRELLEELHWRMTFSAAAANPYNGATLRTICRACLKVMPESLLDTAGETPQRESGITTTMVES